MRRFFQYLSREIMTIGVIGLFGYNAATGRVPGPEEFARFLEDGRILAPIIELGESRSYHSAEDEAVQAIAMVGKPVNIAALSGGGRSRSGRGGAYLAVNTGPIFLQHY